MCKRVENHNIFVLYNYLSMISLLLGSLLYLYKKGINNLHTATLWYEESGQVAGPLYTHMQQAVQAAGRQNITSS